MCKAPHQASKELCRNTCQVLKLSLACGLYVPSIDEMKSYFVKRKAQHGIGSRSLTTLISLKVFTTHTYFSALSPLMNYGLFCSSLI